MQQLNKPPREDFIKHENDLLDFEDIDTLPNDKEVIRTVWKHAGISFDLDKVLNQQETFVLNKKYTQSILLKIALMEAVGFSWDEIAVFTVFYGEPGTTLEDEKKVLKVIRSRNFSEDFKTFLKISSNVERMKLKMHLQRESVYDAVIKIQEITGLPLQSIFKKVFFGKLKSDPILTFRKTVNAYIFKLANPKKTWQQVLVELGYKKIGEKEVQGEIRRVFTAQAYRFVRKQKEK